MYFWSLHNAQLKCLFDVSWVRQGKRREFVMTLAEKFQFVHLDQTEL